MKYGLTIGFLRKKLNISQKEVARTLNLSIMQISNIERNESNLTLENLKKICKLFNISFDKFEELTDYLSKF